MKKTDKTPNLHLKHMAEVERRQGEEGSSDAAKALLRQPKSRGKGRAEHYARVERGVET